MKKSAIARIVIWSLVIALLIGLLAIGLGYRSFRNAKYRNLWNNNVTNQGDNTSGAAALKTSADFSNTEDNYNIPADEVREISVDWAAGKITVSSADVSEIRFSETGSSKYPMVWKLKNGKLDIGFCEDDLHFGFRNFGFLNFGEKDLTILVPRDFSCEELEVDTASTTLEVSDLTIRKVDLDTASGICRFQNCNISELDIDTASGDVFFQGTLDALDFDAASAGFTGVLSNIPNRMAVDSMSGELDLTLPENAGFTVKMDGMNNDFTSDFPTTMRGGSYVCGDGRLLIDMDGMNNDVTIRKAASSPAAVPGATTVPEAPAAPEAPTDPDAPTVP